ncbi:unnamed protein product [Bemisia tabaci]|uniref:Transmembrane protein n=1 Tax=Bemisia tabaci TaxID=7038 RepID=A0A9P0ADD6_BEMTA|nr:unnamed protein product [Bemisia tabaci]
MDRLTTPSLEKVAPRYREWLLYSQIQAVSPIFSMFSKFAVLVYCLPVIVYILDCDLEPWMKIAAVSCYSMASLVVLIVYLLQQDISVKSGQAPVDRLNIAYKFSPPTESLDGLNKEVRKIARQFSELRRIFFFYTTTDVVDLGCAGGIILTEEMATDAAQKKNLVKAGFKLLSTPPVSHAVFSEYPIKWWLPLSQWLACYRTYPRVHRYCEKHNLSAYPMIEIYNRHSILFIAPLARQDAFVVPEAEDTIARAKIKIDELEDEASGTEASNSEVSDNESELDRVSLDTGRSVSVKSESKRSFSGKSESRRSLSVRSSVLSTVSKSTVMSYHSTYDAFSDDEDAQKNAQKEGKETEGFFRRSMSSCARRVKHMLGFSAAETIKEIAETTMTEESVSHTKLDEGGKEGTVNGSVGLPSTSTARSKSANGLTERGLQKSVSQVVSALNLLGTEGESSGSCAAQVKLELKAESVSQCATSVQNSFQVPTVSFVGA